MTIKVIIYAVIVHKCVSLKLIKAFI